MGDDTRTARCGEAARSRRERHRDVTHPSAPQVDGPKSPLCLSFGPSTWGLSRKAMDETSPWIRVRFPASPSRTTRDPAARPDPSPAPASPRPRPFPSPSAPRRPLGQQQIVLGGGPVGADLERRRGAVGSGRDRVAAGRQFGGEGAGAAAGRSPSSSPSAGPLIISFSVSPVWLAVTKTTASGAWVLIGGCGWFWFCGSCWCFSGPTPIAAGCTTMPFSPIVTLTRVGTAGRGSLGCALGAATGNDQRQDQRGERAAPRDSGSPENHLGGESSRRGGRQLQP